MSWVSPTRFCVPTAPLEACFPHPSFPSLSGHNLRDKPCMEGTCLAPALTADLHLPTSRSCSASFHSGLTTPVRGAPVPPAAARPPGGAGRGAAARAVPFPGRTAEARLRPRSALPAAGWRLFPAAAKDAQPLPPLSAHSSLTSICRPTPHPRWCHAGGLGCRPSPTGHGAPWHHPALGASRKYGEIFSYQANRDSGS